MPESSSLQGIMPTTPRAPQKGRTWQRWGRQRGPVSWRCARGRGSRAWPAALWGSCSCASTCSTCSACCAMAYTSRASPAGHSHVRPSHGPGARVGYAGCAAATCAAGRQLLQVRWSMHKHLLPAKADRQAAADPVPFPCLCSRGRTGALGDQPSQLPDRVQRQGPPQAVRPKQGPRAEGPPRPGLPDLRPCDWALPACTRAP